MDFLLSSRRRVVAQLNSESGQVFNPDDFDFSAPERLNDAGGTRVVLTPRTEEINAGVAITVNYDRRVLEGEVTRLSDHSDAAVRDFIDSLQAACRVEFDEGSWRVTTDDQGTWLIIDDYVAVAKLKLESTPDERL